MPKTKTAFIFHCSGGSPYIHWYPWLKRHLKELGVNVHAPQFPRYQEQTRENWLKTLEPLQAELNDAILIGHSLGVPFIINILNDWNIQAKGAFLVAGFTGPLETDHGEPNVREFAEREFDWEKIRARCRQFELLASDNDQLVPLEKTKELAENVHGNLTIIPDGGHFQAQKGWVQFPELLEKIRQLI